MGIIVAVTTSAVAIIAEATGLTTKTLSAWNTLFPRYLWD